MVSVWWLPFLLFAVTSAELFPVEKGRALGAVGPTAKNAVHRERLALYNLLDTPGQLDVRDAEIHPTYPYIPIQTDIQQQDTSSQIKELPYQPAIFAPAFQLPSKSIRAPYATAQFMPFVNHHQLYQYQPLAVYAPTYPYVYKPMMPEDSS